MTIVTLNDFGINVKMDDPTNPRKFTIKGNQFYKSPGIYIVEGDWSGAAFLIAAGVIVGPEIEIKGLNVQSIQGDREIISILKRMGAKIEEKQDSLVVKRSELIATEIDASNIPDLVPILATIATQAKGITKIKNAGRLRIKESDRLSSIATELTKMGAKITEKPDSLEIIGVTRLHGAKIDPHNDHRIAMSCAIAGMIADGQTIIENPEVIAKSYPDFFCDMRKLGATMLSQTAPIGQEFKVRLYGGSHEKLIGIKMTGIPIGTKVSMEKYVSI